MNNRVSSSLTADIKNRPVVPALSWKPAHLFPTLTPLLSPVRPVTKKSFLQHVEDLCASDNARFQEEFAVSVCVSA